MTGHSVVNGVTYNQIKLIAPALYIAICKHFNIYRTTFHSNI